MDETCGRMQGQKVRHAEGVALSGVPVNTKPHADTTLEILIQLRAEGARAKPQSLRQKDRVGSRR